MSQQSTRLCAQCVRATSSRAGGALGAVARPSSRLQHVRESRRCVHYAGTQQLRQSVGYGPSLMLDTRSASGPGSAGLGKQRFITRQYATASEGVAVKEEDVEEQEARKPSSEGPIPEYNARVKAGTLRDDPFQRAIIQHLQDLHEMLRGYKPPKVVHPTAESLSLKPKHSLFGSLFGRRSASTGPTISPNLPKGLYMYGDVGCGKTMLMDLFYDTLPSNITSKTRIHFHNFMQDVHKRLHVVKMRYGTDFDSLPMVAADIAEQSSVLCFDEFQCTDVADAMILRRLIELLMSHGVVIVTTSNRHPDELYKNGIQRESFIPCIELLKTELTVLNLNSDTDYRKIPRPPSGVYHHPLDLGALRHADKWFEYLGDPVNDPPHPATHEVWGRTIEVPLASGRAARFTFQQLLGRATGAADYIELCRHYDAFIVTDIPAMTLNQRDLVRRFITFVDAVYESRAKLVLTTEVPIQRLFLSDADIKESLSNKTDSSGNDDLPEEMRGALGTLGVSVSAIKDSFSGDEEVFAFARLLSRLTEMGSKQWVERGLGIGMNVTEGKNERDAYQKTRSRWSEDSM